MSTAVSQSPKWAKDAFLAGYLQKVISITKLAASRLLCTARPLWITANKQWKDCTSMNGLRTMPWIIRRWRHFTKTTVYSKSEVMYKITLEACTVYGEMFLAQLQKILAAVTRGPCLGWLGLTSCNPPKTCFCIKKSSHSDTAKP